MDTFWKMRLEQCRDALAKNNFTPFVAHNTESALEIILREILPKLDVTSVSWGDSMSMRSTGILEEIERRKEYHLLKTFEPGVAREEIIERRRQALLVDLFFTGTNAVTEDGKLVNLDMVGNRVAALTFGPKHVVVVVGRNKIVPDVPTAMERIKSYAAPVNAIRHPGFKTPCIQTSRCMDCRSPDRICNTWTITEKSFPKGRIKVVLVNQDLGL
nr:lactate utilization protein [uncultured Desulfobulbus sp.]